MSTGYQSSIKYRQLFMGELRPARGVYDCLYFTDDCLAERRV
ncbi:MAG TPA: hypothetical protein VFK11_00205 [Candidatus Saccharimonadales bacterium]|nr:hypothetical protein [Candidatus Saccharimonadales bacterium]